MTTQRAVLFGALVLVSEVAAAHGGGLNSEDCHHDRKNGGYHCHRGGPPQSPENSFAQSQRLTSAQSDSVYFANCSAARAAGAAPVRRGDPGYARHLDRDGDGVGCE
jgi:hypothetical protein